MGKTLTRLVLCCAVLAPAIAPRAGLACPYCKVAPGGMAAAEEAEPDDGALHLKYSGGIDFPSAYFFRGYLQADHGPILQPYLNVFTTKHWGDVVVHPYISLFNSTHWGDNNPMPEMSDVMLGATIMAHGLLVDARYAYFDANPTMNSSVHELGIKISTDVLAECQDPDAPVTYGVRPFFGYYGELSDEEGTEDSYIGLGIEPSCRFDLGGRNLGIAVPLEWGLSNDGYYLDAAGNDESYGYFSGTVAATLSLPGLCSRGEWYLNASFQYLHLNADSVLTANHNVPDAYVGKLGLAFIF